MRPSPQRSSILSCTAPPYVGIGGRSYPVAVTPDLVQHVAQGDLASPDSHDLNRQAATNTCPICRKPFVATRRQANARR
jgi:hypothetical protein